MLSQGLSWGEFAAFVLPREAEMQWNKCLIPLCLTGFLPENFA